jgi:excisionase family DNA binding protein
MTERRAISLHDVAKRLGYSYETVRRLAVSGRIPAFKLGRWKVYEDEFDNFVAKLQTENAERGRGAVREN